MNVKESLKRKIGPLPAWAWLTVLALGLYIYRRGGVGSLRAGMGSASTDTTAAGADASNGSLQTPITLGPGESVYDPNTGQLIGGGGSAGASDTSTSDTGGTAPGDTNGSGDSTTPTVTGGTSATSTRAPTRAGFHAGHSAGHQYFLPGVGWISKAKYNAAKRKNKRTISKGKAAPQPGNTKSRKRSGATLVNGLRKKKASKPPKGRERGAGHIGGAPRPRTRTHKVGTAPVMRQHPAASPKIVHPETQKVTNHPDRQPHQRTQAVQRHPRRRKK